MKHVFISYKRNDRSFASELESKLIDAGFDTWTDNALRAGENWRDSIDEAIHASFALIVLVTAQSRKSEYVTYEWAFAMGLGIPIVPIMLTQTKLHPKLEPLHYIDFTDRFGEPWSQLIDRIKQIKEGMPATSIPLPRGASPAVKNAVMMLDHPDGEVIFNAVDALSKMCDRDPFALECLLQATKHVNPEVRAYSVLYLGELRHEAALTRLIEMLSEERDNLVIPKNIRLLYGRDLSFKNFILRVIEKLGVETVFQRLLEPLTKTTEDRVHDKILDYLESYGDEQIANDLTQAVRVSVHPMDQGRFIKTITKLGGQSTPPHIIKLMSKIKSRDDRRTLLRFIGKNGRGQNILDNLMSWLPTADEMFGQENKRHSSSRYNRYNLNYERSEDVENNDSTYEVGTGKALLICAVIAVGILSDLPIPPLAVDIAFEESTISEHFDLASLIDDSANVTESALSALLELTTHRYPQQQVSVLRNQLLQVIQKHGKTQQTLDQLIYWLPVANQLFASNKIWARNDTDLPILWYMIENIAEKFGLAILPTLTVIAKESQVVRDNEAIHKFISINAEPTIISEIYGFTTPPSNPNESNI